MAVLTRAVVDVAFAFVARITIIESSETVHWFIMHGLELLKLDGAAASVCIVPAEVVR